MQIMHSELESVTVYQSGAFVSRSLEINAQNGQFPDQIEVPLLPLALFDPMVRVRVCEVAPHATQLVASNIRVGLYVLPRTTIEAPQTAMLKDSERDFLRISRQLQQNEFEMALLGKIKVPRRPDSEAGSPPPASPMAARLALEQFTDASIGQRIAQRRDLRKQIKALQLRISQLRDELKRSSDALKVKPGNLSKSVQISLRATGGKLTKARLQVEYFIPGARWAPTYQVKFAHDGHTATVQLRAVVCQQSGEDWRGVKLHLSTAAPLRWSELPELAAIRMGKQQRPVAITKGFRPAPVGVKGLFDNFDLQRNRTTHLLPKPRFWSTPSLDIPSLPEWPLTAPPTADPEVVLSALADMDLADLPNEAAKSQAAAADLASPQQVPPMPRKSPPSSKQSKRRSTVKAAVDRPDALQSTPTIPDDLAYTQLNLAPPTDINGRNRLQPIDGVSQYRESLRACSAVVLDQAIIDSVRDAERKANAVATLALPEGTSDVAALGGHFDYTYHADAMVDVPSDGSFHSLALGNREAQSELRYVVVPREDTHVYRTAKLSNPSAAPLLPGPAEVYVGRDYVLTTPLPLVAANGEFRLDLGVEQGIKCVRNTRYNEQRSGEKVVAMRELHHHIEIEIVNNLKREIFCEIRERIPQADAAAEVVVTETKVTPAWQSYDQLIRGLRVIGGRHWKAQLNAGEKAQFKAKYVIKLYANNELIGGNRREA